MNSPEVFEMAPEVVKKEIKERQEKTTRKSAGNNQFQHLLGELETRTRGERARRLHWRTGQPEPDEPDDEGGAAGGGADRARPPMQSEYVEDYTF